MKPAVGDDVAGPLGRIQRQPLDCNELRVRALTTAGRRFAAENGAVICAPPNVRAVGRFRGDIREQALDADVNPAFLENLAGDARAFILALLSPTSGEHPREASVLKSAMHEEELAIAYDGRLIARVSQRGHGSMIGMDVAL
jgi:hypothetical protein